MLVLDSSQYSTLKAHIGQFQKSTDVRYKALIIGDKKAIKLIAWFRKSCFTGLYRNVKLSMDILNAKKNTHKVVMAWPVK